MVCRQLDELITPTEEECIGTNHKPIRLQLRGFQLLPPS
jgi:hypothetical protein